MHRITTVTARGIVHRSRPFADEAIPAALAHYINEHSPRPRYRAEVVAFTPKGADRPLFRVEFQPLAEDRARANWEREHLKRMQSALGEGPAYLWEPCGSGLKVTALGGKVYLLRRDPDMKCTCRDFAAVQPLGLLCKHLLAAQTGKHWPGAPEADEPAPAPAEPLPVEARAEETPEETPEARAFRREQEFKANQLAALRAEDARLRDLPGPGDPAFLPCTLHLDNGPARPGWGRLLDSGWFLFVPEGDEATRAFPAHRVHAVRFAG